MTSHTVSQNPLQFLSGLPRVPEKGRNRENHRSWLKNKNFRKESKRTLKLLYKMQVVWDSSLLKCGMEGPLLMFQHSPVTYKLPFY